MTAETGSLNAGERMERIEAALGRIETKLDDKASTEDVHDIRHRLTQLESGDTPLARVMLKQFEATAGNVNKIMEEGSPDAQEALRRVVAVEADVDNLKSAALTRRATDRQLTVTSDRHYRILTVIISVAVILVMVLTATGNIGPSAPQVRVQVHPTVKQP